MARKPKPALALWLIDQRKAHGETVNDVARVTDRTEATVRGWEAGRPPQSDDAVIAHLERHWGAIAPREVTESTGVLAAAVSGLTEELHFWRKERESLEARLRAVEAELESLRDPPGDEALPVQSAPPQTAG